MTTSGTVGQTVISTAKVLEHALRRTGISASMQTPETVSIARECLHLLLTHYANTTLNLWCIEKVILGYTASKASYQLPVGTSDVLNVVHASPQVVQSTLAANKCTLAQQSTLSRIGLMFSVLPTTDVVVTASLDDATYTTLLTIPVADVIATDVTYWFDIDPLATCAFIQVTGGTVSVVVPASTVTEIPITPLNRDQYADLPNKTMVSEVVTNYLFNKTLYPTIALWPIPSNSEKHMVLWVHRQAQDVGGLTQTLAIPQRWFEATIIQLAFRLSMELPGVDPTRITLLSGLADKFKIEAVASETDSSPTFINPGIAAYTR